MTDHPHDFCRVRHGDCLECDIETVEDKLNAVEVERIRLLTHLRGLRALLANRNGVGRAANVVLIETAGKSKT